MQRKFKYSSINSPKLSPSQKNCNQNLKSIDHDQRKADYDSVILLKYYNNRHNSEERVINFFQLKIVHLMYVHKSRLQFTLIQHQEDILHRWSK